MPIFAHLDHEDEVQTNDRTRIDASKTFITPAEGGVFSNLTIRPGDDQVDIQVYDDKVAQRYLDWEFSELLVDIDSSNESLDFLEAGTEKNATLATATYTLSDLASEIQTQMNSVGDNTYSVTIDDDDKLTISTDTAFDLTLTGTNKNTSLMKDLFFDPEELTGKTSYTSSRIEYGRRNITVIAGDDKLQKQIITAIANTSHALAGTYFLIWIAGNATKYYVWFSDGTGSDPGVAGATGVHVTVSNNDTATTVATAIASALDSLSGFVSSATGSVVTVTNAATGYALPAREGIGTGFTFEVDVYGQSQVSEVSHLNVYSESGDRLFSGDSQLEDEEPDIRKYVRQGRNSFLNIHRHAQRKIMEFLDRKGYVNAFREKFTKWDVADLAEFHEWSRYMVLRMIFEGVKTGKDDVFNAKMDSHSSNEIEARQRAIIRIDVNKDGSVDPWEGFDNNSIKVFFR